MIRIKTKIMIFLKIVIAFAPIFKCISPFFFGKDLQIEFVLVLELNVRHGKLSIIHDMCYGSNHSSNSETCWNSRPILIVGKKVVKTRNSCLRDLID